MMQVMMYVLPDYLAAPGENGIDPPLRSLLLWAACILTLPALLYAAAPFWRGAWRSLRAGRPGMDVPVALGIACAFGASVVALLRGSGATYFDAVSMFIFLLLASQYLELRARCAAAALLQRLRHALPPAALLLSDYPSRQGTLVPAAALQAGDYVLVPAGESVPADGVLADPAAEVVLALLTGEPMPQQRQAGDPVPSGAVNSGQAMVLRVSRPAGESTLALLAALVERAGLGKPAIALWADRVGAWFVAALLVLAALVLLLWYPHGAARAWEVAVAVLVVSCPCALSLATPAALAAAGSRLLRGGVLVVQPHVLETLRRATHVVFDKTGTLTKGAPALVGTEAFGDVDASDCLHIAAALAGGSTHPLAKALVAANKLTGLAASELQQHTGAGMSGTIDGHAWRLGNARFVNYDGPADSDASCVYLAREGEVMARFSLRDTVRDDAAALVSALQKRGIEVIILSGDATAPVRGVAASLGVRDWRAGQLPQDKLDAVLALQAGGAVVAMVGDGINDAAVLRAADVSFAMGKGSDLACLNADCMLLRDSLDSLQLCVDVAHRTMAVIRQNLAWALVYNACAIPAAALGLLQPWMAAAGMSLSSAVVVVNALRLRREH
jgi:Cu2+-exporting ATPase